MLPFLKNRDDGVGQGPVEKVEREHDDDYDMLDAIAEDVLAAIETKDKARLKSALQSLVSHIQDQDAEQDQMEATP